MNYTFEVIDNEQMGEENRKNLRIQNALSYVQSTMETLAMGGYTHRQGRYVDMISQLDEMMISKLSIPGGMALPNPPVGDAKETHVVTSNTQTTSALRDLTEQGYKTLALNFANGTSAGGGFLRGSKAQEETICRQSGLYLTLDGDRMYAYHRAKGLWSEASDWSILSQKVPFFRGADNEYLPSVWVGDVLTCAAPIAFRLTPERSADLMRSRVRRVFEIARAYGYDALVLGAWGCGAFGNDKRMVAGYFRDEMDGEFAGVFKRITFAISDWSPERATLCIFAEVLGGGGFA